MHFHAPYMPHYNNPVFYTFSLTTGGCYVRTLFPVNDP
nr:MAG TPA_asm: hypothetical protein [Caudoviricetes sp.]